MTTDVVTGINPEVARYLAAVEARLAGLPPGERSELIEDLAGHLEELTVEGGPSLTERIGTPESYAAEFLASLGMSAAGTVASRRVRLAEAVRGSAPVRAVDRLRRSGAGQEGRSLWEALRPAWWIARAYVTVVLAAYLIAGRQFPRFPVPNLLSHTVYGGVAIVAAILLSVHLGRNRSRGTVRVLVVGANVGLLVFALILVGRTGHRLDASNVAATSSVPANVSNQVSNSQNCLTNDAGGLITNLYPYTPDGKLIQVLLYDQEGHAVDNLCPYYDSGGRPLNNQYARDVNGAAVYNVFPRPQTVDVASSPQAYPPGVVPTPATSPVAPPAIVIPQLVTPTNTVTSTGTVTSTAGSPSSP